MKQTDFAERLTQALDLRGLSAADLSRATGVSEGTISCYKKGKYQAKQNRVYDFARALQVDPAWLMGYDVPIEPQGQNAPQAKCPTLPAGAIPVRPGPMIPVLGQVRCGLPMYAEENIIGYESLAGKAGEQYFALNAVGDSMNAAGINEGDTVIVQKQDVVEPNQIAVVCVNGDEATLKRFRQENNLVFLSPQSYNPAHQIQVYDLKKTPVHIMGRVVEIRKKVL